MTLPLAHQHAGLAETENEDIPRMRADELTAENIQTILPDVYEQLRSRFVAEGQHQGIAQERAKIEGLIKACRGNGGHLIAALTNEQAAADLLKNHADELDAKRDKLRRQNTELRGDIEDRQAATLSDEQLRQRFAASPDLQDRFSCDEAYIAYIRHLGK